MIPALLSIPLASRLCGMTIDAPRYQRFVVASMMIGCAIMIAGDFPVWTADLFAALWVLFRIWRVGKGFDATHPEYDTAKRNKGMLWMIGRALFILPLFIAVGYFAGNALLGGILGGLGAVWMGLSYRFAPEAYALSGRPIKPNCYNVWAEWSEGMVWMILVSVML